MQRRMAISSCHARTRVLDVLSQAFQDFLPSSARRLAWMALAFASVACSASSSTGVGPRDGGDSGDFTCYLEAGLWHCPGGGAGVPSCSGIMNPDTPCNYDGGGCIYCSVSGRPGPDNPGTAEGCTCDHTQSATLDAGDSATWGCVASNWLCQ